MEKLLSSAEIFKKTREKWFQIVGERLLYKKGFTLVWLMVFNSTTLALSKRRLSRKSVSTRRNEAFDKKSVSTSRKNCFGCYELKSSKKIDLHLISSRKCPLPLARTKNSLKNAISLDRKATSIWVTISKKKKKWRKRFHPAEIRFFFCKYWRPSNCNNGFQKNLNERISSPLNRKSVASGSA